MNDAEHLAALARMHGLLESRRIDYWLFGGWAVDFYAGSITRPHDDVDIAVWLKDHARIAELLSADGWRHAPHEDEDGGTGYERDGIRLELTFLVRDEQGRLCIALRSGPAVWAEDAFGDDIAELRGVRARVMSRSALTRGKAQARDDPGEAAKDRADSATLGRLG